MIRAVAFWKNGRECRPKPVARIPARHVGAAFRPLDEELASGTPRPLFVLSQILQQNIISTLITQLIILARQVRVPRRLAPGAEETVAARALGLHNYGYAIDLQEGGTVTERAINPVPGGYRRLRKHGRPPLEDMNRYDALAAFRVDRRLAARLGTPNTGGILLDPNGEVAAGAIDAEPVRARPVLKRIGYLLGLHADAADEAGGLALERARRIRARRRREPV